MKRINVLLAGAALTLTALNGCGGGHGAAKAGEPAAGPVLLSAADVATVTVTDLVQGVPLSGTLRPGTDVQTRSPFADVVETVRVREGQAVRRGEVLARFRTGALGPAAASAEARRRHAESDYTRMRNLAAAGAVSQREVEDAEAALKAADAAHADARKRLGEATVRAPISGVVSERSVQSGDRVSDGDPLFRIVDTRELEFEATIPGEHVGAVKVGAPVRLTVSGSETPVIGRIARVNATADEATRQVRVYVSVSNPGRALVGGLFASGQVVTREARQVPAVPAGAVRAGAEGTSVMVVEDGRLARRAVTTGVRDLSRDLVQALSGVAPGDTVLIGALQGLEPGQRVTVGGKGR